MMVRTCVALAAATLFAGAAHAASTTALTADQMLQQFNVVTTGNLVSTSHVDGRAYVGGNLQGGDFVQHASQTAASSYAGLTVVGSVNANGGQDVHVNGLGAVVGGSATGLGVNKGQAYVGGNATRSSFNGDAWVTGAASGVNFNGYAHAASLSNGTNNNRPLAATTALMDSTRAAVATTDFAHVMDNMSTKLSALAGTAGTKVAFSNNDHQVTFSGTGDADGLLIFDLTKLDTKIFSSTTTDLSFNLTNATTVVFNTNDKVLSLTANFNQAIGLGSSLIWNFDGADSVTVGRTFGGQVLVADGTFSNVGGANVEGGVYAKTFNQYGEVHLQAFSGSLATAVPEAETYAMLLAGLGLLGFMARRRKQG
ncbi:MAG: collagen-binding domain-containing protein [Duganella sp.]